MCRSKNLASLWGFPLPFHYHCHIKHEDQEEPVVITTEDDTIDGTYITPSLKDYDATA